jgi:hypothetical protein
VSLRRSAPLLSILTLGSSKDIEKEAFLRRKRRDRYSQSPDQFWTEDMLRRVLSWSDAGSWYRLGNGAQESCGSCYPRLRETSETTVCFLDTGQVIEG